MHTVLAQLRIYLAVATVHHSSYAARQRAVFTTLAIIIALVMVVVLTGIIIHKLIHRKSDTHDSISGGFSLADLRKLHDAGQMSDEEFQAAKTLVISHSRKILENNENQNPNKKAALPPADDDNPQDPSSGSPDKNKPSE